MSSGKNSYDKAYDQSYQEGKKSDAMDQFSHGLSNFTLRGEDQKMQDSRNAGFSDGVADKYDSGNSHYSGSGSSGSSGK